MLYAGIVVSFILFLTGEVVQKVIKMLAASSAILWVLAVVAFTEGANVLGIYSAISPSHLIIHMSTANALAEAGHNVTVVSMLRPKVIHNDIHLILVPMTKEQELSMDNTMSSMAKSKNDVISTMFLLLNDLSVMVNTQADLLSDPRFLRIYETKFDLMILGSFFNDFQLGVAGKLKVPVIVDWMIPSHIMIDQFVANPFEISYVPNESTVATPPMTFFKRAENMMKHVILRYLALRFDYKFIEIYNEIFTEKDMPTLSEMKKNISLVFVGSHLISDGPIRPLVPALIEIGGIQVKEKPDPLPQDIEQFLDNSTQGAIFLSFGSNIKSHMVKPEIVQIMYKVLSGLKENIIWKWEDLENTPGNASNILFKGWLPQDDILAHPNTKLFVSHGGKNSITESQYHGVPMVALPIFGDHPLNAAIMVKSGNGVALDFQTITEASFRTAIKEVLENDKYRRAVEKFSALYRDRPLTPRQSVVFWTNYVLRHHGAPHLQSPAVHMSFIELHNLDIFALVLTILIFFVLLTRLIGKFVLSKLLGKVKNLGDKKKQ